MIMRKSLRRLSQSSRCQLGHDYNGGVLFPHLRAARHAHRPPGKRGHHMRGGSFLRFNIYAMHNVDFGTSWDRQPTSIGQSFCAPPRNYVPVTDILLWSEIGYLKRSTTMWKGEY